MSNSQNISRRGFVAGSVLAGISAAMATSLTGSLQETEKAYADSATETKIVKTCCHGCIYSCPVLAYVENGVVVKVEGDPDGPQSKGSLCSKGLNQIHAMYSPMRILHPLKRVGERGENKWEQISWDEAIDLAATNFLNAIHKYGNYSIVTSTGGGGAYTFYAAISLAYSFKSPNSFEPGCAQCYVPRNAMGMLMYGGQNQSMADHQVLEPFNEYLKATESIIIWGTQPSASQVAEAGRAMTDLRARGCKTVVIDPFFTADAAKANVWLPIKPGTDTALIMAWYRYIFENKLYDEEFTKYWTNLPFLIDPDTKLPVLAQEIFPGFVQSTPDNTPAYVCYDLRTGSVAPFEYSLPENSTVDPEIFWVGEYNGKEYKTAGQIYREEAEPWTLEKTGEMCALKPEAIEEAIRIYTDCKASGITDGVFGDQMNSASQITQGCHGLDMIMGYVNKPGCTLTYTPRTLPAPGPTKRATAAMAPMPWMGLKWGIGRTIGKSDAENQAVYDNCENKETQELVKNLLLDRLGMDKYKGLYYTAMSHIPSVHNAIDTGEPYRPRAWFDMSGNKLAQLGNATSWYDSISQFDFICGQNTHLSSFQIEACDLVFPMQEWLEYCGTDRMNQINVTFMRTDVTHIGETVHPEVAAYKVLERIKEMDPEAVDPTFYFGAKSQQECKDSQVATFGAKDWDDLLNNQNTYVPLKIPDEEYWVYDQHLAIADDGLPAGFGTESRKCEVYVTLMIKMARNGYPWTWPYEQVSCDDYTPICKYVEPAELPDEEYPLIMTSGRIMHFHHGTLRYAPFARELTPTAECRMSPATAEQYGIKHMDWIKITSRRGEIRARAYITKGTADGVLWMERFWNPECYHESQKNKTAGWREQNINVLTMSDGSLNECFGSYTLRGFTVRIEKSEKPDNVWVEPEQFEPYLPTLQNEPVTEVTF